MTKQSYIDAIQAGVSELREETRAAEEQRRQSPAAAFNAASGVIEALETLRDMKGSKFKILNLVKQSGKVSIETNLQSPGAAKGYHTHVTVHADGEILVGASENYSDERRLSFKASEQDTPEKVLRFLAKRAASQGLIS